MHPIEVEAALPHREHARVREEVLDLRTRALVVRARVVWVHPDRGVDAVELSRELERAAARPGVDTDADQGLDARRIGLPNAFGRVPVEQEQMAVGVDRASVYRRFRVRLAHGADMLS